MGGRLPVGKGCFDGNAVLVGAAMCPAMVNSFLAFENNYHFGQNGIRHSRRAGASAEVDQNPVELAQALEEMSKGRG